MKTIRLAVLNTHPIQYFAPFYRVLDQSPLIEPTVLYLSDVSLRGGRDPGFGLSVSWDIDLLDGYASRFIGAAQARTPRGFFSLIAPGLWPELTSGRYDAVLIHGHNFAANWIALAAARAAGLTVLARGDSHADLERGGLKAALRRPIVRAFYHACHRYLAIGSRNAAFYRDLGMPADRIVLAPFAVDNERFAAARRQGAGERARTRARHGIDADRPAVLFVGKLTPQKRPADLIEAMARLRAQTDARCSLVFCGSGELEAELRGRCAGAGLDKVVFTGFVNQAALPGLYAAADIFAFPADGEESWGLAVNEAMAAGLPVVVSRQVGCAADLVVDGVNGFLPQTGDIDAWSQALGRLVASPALRAAQGRASAEQISSWSYRECLDGFHRALEGAVAPPMAARRDDRRAAALTAAGR
ncbi:MAG TPA: glycosyltransferase family 4 protein [Caulobacteraceae bacterium]|jgi:glycosyltransferase involved in cell wall biosynthesis|nr:glycosyltransferase family 4 protein [Caulobacteraceae bacterium]